MNKRPPSITVIGWVFLCVGTAALVAGTWRFFGAAAHAETPADSHQDLADLALVWTSAFMAGVGGAWVLRGRDWARWLLVIWMGFHIVVSMLHSPFELAVHSVLFAVAVLILFRAPASGYFRCARAEPP